MVIRYQLAYDSDYIIFQRGVVALPKLWMALRNEIWVALTDKRCYRLGRDIDRPYWTHGTLLYESLIPPAGGSIPNDLVFHKRQTLDWLSVGRQFGKEALPALR